MATMKILLIGLIVVSAQAGVIFENPWSTEGSNCSYNTNCGAGLGYPNTYAAQLFSLSRGAAVSSASVTNWLLTSIPGIETQPTAINWMFLTVNGATGLPGSVLFAGTGAAITSRTSLGTVLNFDVVRANFDLPGVTLASGDCYFAVQAVSSLYYVYLSSGTLASGGARTPDGGVTWSAGYSLYDSIAVSLSGDAAVPEPGSWTLLLSGFGLLGVALRRPRQAR